MLILARFKVTMARKTLIEQSPHKTSFRDFQRSGSPWPPQGEPERLLPIGLQYRGDCDGE